MFKYIRAFFVALILTLRGQRPIPKRHAALGEWIAEAEKRVIAAYKAAEQHGIDAAKRKTISARVDGRPRTMESILGTVRYHVKEEYPYLLSNETQHNLTAIYATNVNDQYAVMRLAEVVEQEPVRAALQALQTHLESLPQPDVT